MIFYVAKNMFNGTHLKTCLIREKDDTFIHFNVDEIICVKPLDIESFIDLYESRKDEWNIILDNRLEYLILMSFIKYGLDVIVYDTHKLFSYPVIEYFSTSMYIESTEISLEEMKIYCIGKIMITYGLPNLKIRWNKDIELEAIHKKRTLNMKYNVMFMLIHIVNVKNFVVIDKNRIRLIDNLYNQIINCKNITPITNISEDELYSILCLMIDNF